jgi:hypothetical protein
LVYDVTSQIIEAEGVDGCSEVDARRLQHSALRELEVVASPANDLAAPSADPIEDVPALLIDHSVTAATFHQHLQHQEPFTYARFCDGEWFSMLGRPGRNCDGHAYLPGTLGRELRQSLEQLANLAQRLPNIYVGLLRDWLQGDVQYYLRANQLARRCHWVDCHLLLDGLRALSTKRLLLAIRDYHGPKFLVANRRLRLVAKSLGCRHVVVPQKNCYLKIDRAERACRFRGPGLVLLCAGMAAECLIARLLPQNLQATYVDCGHLFDAMVSHPSRAYTKENADGIVDFLHTHYAPMFVRPRRQTTLQLSPWIRRTNGTGPE